MRVYRRTKGSNDARRTLLSIFQGGRGALCPGDIQFCVHLWLILVGQHNNNGITGRNAMRARHVQ